MPSKEEAEPVETSKDGNHLIDSLPSRQRQAVLAQCERVELAAGAVICEAGKPFQYAYFPIGGTISLVSSITGYKPFETESIGSEGMVGATLVLDINSSPQGGIVQTPCLALRVSAGSLQAAMRKEPALSPILQRYLHFALTEILQTAGCVRFHDVRMRLARALLLAHDRAQTDQLPLTHLLLAGMLGVQRGAVTIAAAKLQRAGVIRYTRGKIAILDRPALEAASCGCYEASLENRASNLS
ncbi:cAMP-binding domain of CRP or a regulatory subunit of cAMP-dependent protein kinases [Marinobacter daqiaonensis]|uniref:cAMP-binding domain of CRP or a regulatory subunit of cAMP-dependent protein kinases n=1 Tax=Marinobacter daqiaonensis TaxID=650891 RepID=A0A1I6I4W3_9GAMM|nr:Crp/Fnr family transcriptional regulator [Marinobacter daqiaonensis]SFR61674.1 cAMP-binding domain of CRP or a regulatory subunit of cAMP-dependent protein kinases [Marinobacter daqiaonensis]